MWNKIITLWAIVATFTTVLYFALYKEASSYFGDYHPILDEDECISIITDVDNFGFYPANQALIDLQTMYGEVAAGLYSLLLADCHNYGNYYFYSALEVLYKKAGARFSEETFAFALHILKKGIESEDAYERLSCSAALREIYENGVYVPRDSTLVKHYERISKESAEQEFGTGPKSVSE